MNILEIGSGRNWQNWVDQEEHTVICVDRIYTVDYYAFEDTVCGSEFYESGDYYTYAYNDLIKLMGGELIPFLENYTEKDFNKVIAHRIFEHIPPDQIGYILYLIRQVTRPGGVLEIIVPDYKKVLDDFDKLDPFSTPAVEFNRMMVMTHTEVFNELNDPHQSIWTLKLAEYYLKLEGYWSDIKISNVELDNRHWYLKVDAIRI